LHCSAQGWGILLPILISQIKFESKKFNGKGKDIMVRVKTSNME